MICVADGGGGGILKMITQLMVKMRMKSTEKKSTKS
jgi:hypothetical protein